MKSIPLLIKENRALILILIAGLIIRLIDIAQPFSGLGKWNEGHYAMTALNYFKYGIFLPMNEYGLDFTTTPLYSWFIYLSFLVFGVSEWAARLPSLFFGMASLILVYLLADRLYGRDTANVSAFIVAISPGTAYFSRNIQLESMFTAFALASLLFMIYYKDSGEGKWLLASGIYISIAVLSKYPAILTYPALIWIWLKYGDFRKNKQEITRFFTYLFLSITPALIWFLYALSIKSELALWYFSKPEAPWSFASAKEAIYLALTRFMPEHFGYIFYGLFLISLLWIAKDLNKHAPIILFTFSWLALIVGFPDFYLANMYYHYSMHYGMAILLGFTVVAFWKKVRYTMPKRSLKIIITLMLIALTAQSLYQYNTYFHGYYTDFSRANETAPFESAKHVARVNTAHELVVVDFPQTMYYAGADPAFVRPAYYNDGVLQAVYEDKYSYFVLYYSGNITIREALEEEGYGQIAPRAWYKNLSTSIE